jgi:hypothetical protein
VWAVSELAAIAQAASVPAATGRLVSELAAIVAVPTAIVAVPTAIVVVPMLTVATAPGVRRQRGSQSGLRQLALRPRTTTATNAAIIPIHRATSLTRRLPITSAALGGSQSETPRLCRGI